MEKGRSGRSAANKYGISNVEMQYKYNLYQKHGQIKLDKYAYDWTVEQKCEVLEYMRRNHLSCKQTGIQFGIKGSSTVRKWEKKYLENSKDELDKKKKSKKSGPQKPKVAKQKTQKIKTREEELLDRILYLEAENAYLKKMNALVAEREKKERENK